MTNPVIVGTPGTPPRSVSVPVVVGAALFAAIQAFSTLAPLLLSFLLILLISLAINPLIIRMRTWAGGRRRATGLVTAGLLALMTLTGWAALGPMGTSIARFSEQWPGYWARLQKPLIRMEKQAVLSEQRVEAEVATEIGMSPLGTNVPAHPRTTDLPAPSRVPAENSGSSRFSLGQMVQSVASGVSGVAFNAAQTVTILITVFFGVTFTLMSPRPVVRAIFSVIPQRRHGEALAIARRIGAVVPQWAGATLAGMVTIGLLVLLIMWPVFGFADALVLGLIAGVFEAVPFVGPILSTVPALLLAAGEGGLTPLWVLAGYLAVQALENNVIAPLLMAHGLKLHPLWVILSMLLCLSAFGVLGVLIAAPLVAVTDIVHDELYRKRFLPSVSDHDLDRLARNALGERSAMAE
ncbi:MAG: AI-2E family transporter [Verrucomicrobia bacterium]|nr:AI-2E family transporter [Verrucomicrobiota bacterium]